MARSSEPSWVSSRPVLDAAAPMITDPGVFVVCFLLICVDTRMYLSDGTEPPLPAELERFNEHDRISEGTVYEAPVEDIVVPHMHMHWCTII